MTTHTFCLQWNKLYIVTYFSEKKKSVNGTLTHLKTYELFFFGGNVECENFLSVFICVVKLLESSTENLQECHWVFIHSGTGYSVWGIIYILRKM